MSLAQFPTQEISMRTVKSLREELAKFPDNALCYAYEGEFTGLVILDPMQGRLNNDGLIFCCEDTPPGKDKKTVLFSRVAPESN